MRGFLIIKFGDKNISNATVKQTNNNKKKNIKSVI